MQHTVASNVDAKVIHLLLQMRGRPQILNTIAATIYHSFTRVSVNAGRIAREINVVAR